MKKNIITLGLILTVFLTGCNANDINTNNISGNYKCDDTYKTTLELSENGNIMGESFGKIKYGTWKVFDKETILVTGVGKDSRFKVGNGTLILEDKYNKLVCKKENNND